MASLLSPSEEESSREEVEQFLFNSELQLRAAILATAAVGQMPNVQRAQIIMELMSQTVKRY
jgi:hypothetical protein